MTLHRDLANDETQVFEVPEFYRWPNGQVRINSDDTQVMVLQSPKDPEPTLIDLLTKINKSNKQILIAQTIVIILWFVLTILVITQEVI